MWLVSRNEFTALDRTTMLFYCCHLEFLSSLWISIWTEDGLELISTSSLLLLVMLLLTAIRKRLLLWCGPAGARAALLYVRITVLGESGSSKSSDIDLQWFIVYCISRHLTLDCILDSSPHAPKSQNNQHTSMETSQVKPNFWLLWN